MAKPDPHEPPPPLKDPAEGKPPAVRGQPLVAPGGATYQGGDPVIQESMPTIGDEQRARSAKIEEMGMDAYMKSGETPPSSDEQARIAQVQGHTPPPHPEHEAAKHKSSK